MLCRTGVWGRCCDFEKLIFLVMRTKNGVLKVLIKGKISPPQDSSNACRHKEFRRLKVSLKFDIIILFKEWHQHFNF